MLVSQIIVYSFTEKKQHAVQLTEEAIQNGFRKIIGVGGDGTIHEICQGIIRQNNPDVVFGGGNMATNAKLPCVYAELAAPTSVLVVDTKRQQRRLVDYTQERGTRDGTLSSLSHNTKVTPTIRYPAQRKTYLKMGLPTCFALESSRDDIALGSDKEIDPPENAATTCKVPEVIDFYLKVVVPKSLRKPPRTSSLDTAISRKDLQKQVSLFRHLDASHSARRLGASTRTKRAASL